MIKSIFNLIIYQFLYKDVENVGLKKNLLEIKIYLLEKIYLHVIKNSIYIYIQNILCYILKNIRGFLTMKLESRKSLFCVNKCSVFKRFENVNN